MLFIRTILSLSLAVLVLVSSLGVPLKQHFCGDKLMAWSLYKAAESCGMEKPVPVKSTCDKHPAPAEKPNSCCSDEVLVADSDDFTSNFSKTLEKQLDYNFVVAFTAVFSSLFQVFEPDFNVIPPYSPPVITLDIPVLVQAFLL